MLWYEVLCITIVCIAFFIYSAYVVSCALFGYKKQDNRILGVAIYKKSTIYFTVFTYKRGFYRLTTRDGVYLLPINNTQIHFYKENNNEKQN